MNGAAKVLLVSLLFGLTLAGSHLAHADDGKNGAADSADAGSGNVRIESTSRGVTVKIDEDKDDDDSVAAPGAKADRDEREMRLNGKWMGHRGDRAEDIVVPIAFFVFMIILILGGRLVRERTERQRLDLLRSMVEKGQPVPESVVKEILGGGRRDFRNSAEHRVRRGTGFTIVGAGLLIYGLFQGGQHHTTLVVAIVFLGLGIGNLAAQRFHAGQPRSPQLPPE